MQISDFIKRVGDEPERVIRQTVWTTPPNVLAQAAKSGGMKMTDLLSTPERSAEQREVSYRHVLGPKASRETMDAWQRDRPAHPLPAELQELLMRMNGIHLWARKETGRSYVGLAPIEEWELARIKMYGTSADRDLLDDRYVAISYHQDGASYVVLDVDSARYFLMDVSGPDTTTPIANNVSELLDWLWSQRIAPK